MIKSSSASGGSGPISYSDPLAGTDQPFGFGDNWFDVFSSSSAVAKTSLDANLNRGGSGLTFGPNAGVMRSKHFPVPVDHQQVRRLSLGRTQFSKWTHVLTVNGGGSCNVGVSVFGEANRGGEYLLDRVIVGGQVTLWRDLSVSGVTLISNVFAILAGDTFEIRATYAPGANTIQCIKNDVVIATYVDSDVLRPAGGLYGVTYFGNGAGSNSQTYRDYSGGFI